MPEISIVEIKNIIRSVRYKYKIDLGNYSLNHLRYQLDKIIKNHNVRILDIMIHRLMEDDEFFDHFLDDLTMNDTEIFRDPEMWTILRDEILKILQDRSDTIRVWFPEVSNALELYSMLIILNEYQAESEVLISASSITNTGLLRIKQGQMDKKILEISHQNIQNLRLTDCIDQYFTRNNNEIFFDRSLLKNVNFFKTDIGFSVVPDQADLIIFRNKLLSFARDQQNSIMQRMDSVLSDEGFCVMVIKEYADDFLRNNTHFGIFNKSESIYKKTGSKSE